MSELKSVRWKTTVSTVQQEISRTVQFLRASAAAVQRPSPSFWIRFRFSSSLGGQRREGGRRQRVQHTEANLLYVISMFLYLRDDPRALVLVSTSDEERLLPGSSAKGLLFKSTSDTGPKGSSTRHSQVVVEFLSTDEIDLDNVVRLTNRPIHGCLGLLNVGAGD